jgi:hypothetical protein
VPVMRPHKLALPPDATEAGLLERLEPYLRVDQITPVHAWGYAPPVSCRWLEVTGKATPQGGPPVPEFATQDEVWAHADAWIRHLFFTARAAIQEAQDAGYTHCRHPQIEIGGDIHHDKEARLDIPRSECTVRMWLMEAQP